MFLLDLGLKPSYSHSFMSPPSLTSMIGCDLDMLTGLGCQRCEVLRGSTSLCSSDRGLSLGSVRLLD